MTDSYKYKGLRKRLVNTLIEKGISDKRVLTAIEKIPRHFFLDNAFAEHAYQDKAFQIGHGQTISQPYTVAFQSSLLEVKKGERILEVGTGSGYQSCVLLEMGAEVYTVETIPELHKEAKRLLAAMGYYPNFFLGDGSLGLPEIAPFDKILVTAGAPDIPTTYLTQLKPGGMLVIPVGNDRSQTMTRIIKMPDNSFITEQHGEFKFVPLTGHLGW